MNIGFIGLGNMGLPMAVNLSKQNHKVVGFDILKKTDKILEIASNHVLSSWKDASRREFSESVLYVF